METKHIRFIKTNQTCTLCNKGLLKKEKYNHNTYKFTCDMCGGTEYRYAYIIDDGPLHNIANSMIKE